MSKTNALTLAFQNAQDGVEEALTDAEANYSLDDLLTALESASDTVREEGESNQEKADNMEQYFPNGSPTLDILHDRVERCETLAGELDDARTSIKDKLDILLVEINDIVNGIDWSEP